MVIKSSIDINKEILNIWRGAKKAGFKKKTGESLLSPCFFTNSLVAPSCDLLIVGLNPSHSHTNWKRIIKKYNPSVNESRALKKLITIISDKTKGNGFEEINHLLDDYFKFDKLGNKEKEIISLDNTALKAEIGLDYFKKMHKLAEYIYNSDSPPWLHLDLYFYRKTNQNYLKKLIDLMPPFFQSQIYLSKDIIFWLKPSIILVANVYAGEVFREMYFPESRDGFFENVPLNDKTGAYDLSLDENHIAHVFFTGMFSGQRAMDNGSYHRLKWHLKAVHESKTMQKF